MLGQLCRGMLTSLRASSPMIQTRMSSNSSQKKLAGKVAVVTASTDGIGLAIAKRLCQDGARVMISSRKQQNVDRALQELGADKLQAAGVVCHVAHQDDRKRLLEETVKQFGGIDILVSNAAANPYFGPTLDTPEEAWDKIFDTNVKATFLLCKEAVPLLEKRGSSSIVIVSSLGGFNPFPMIGAYSVSKTALLGLTKTLAAELAHRNVRVNCLAPGIIKTRFSKALWENDGASRESLKQIPMHRFGKPEECSGIVSFLASDDSSYITGESFIVSGGLPSRL